MIEVRVKELLQERSRTFYWLAKQTGISHTTLWRLKKGKAYGVTLDTLDKICQALDCQPGDILRYVSARPARKRNAKAKT
jgi:putative transcriptional regulator